MSIQRTNELNFLNKAKKAFPEYDYSKVKYVNNITPVIVCCPKHGEFLIKPETLTWHKRGCPMCMAKKQMLRVYDSNQIYDTDNVSVSNVNSENINEQENKNQQSQVSSNQVTNKKTNEEYICEIYDFIVSTISTLPEDKQNQISVSKNSTIFDNHVDIEIKTPERHVCIDFIGFKTHNEKYMDRKTMVNKTTELESHGIQLISLWENEWVEKQEICKSRIRQIIGITKFRIFARQCKIREISSSTACSFIENNHIQGKIAAPIAYGLFYYNKSNNKEYLVACMTFGNLRKNMGQTSRKGWYELYRFCNLMNFTIVGGASKLFKHFLKIYKPTHVISFANRRWSTNNQHTLYNHLGFKYDGVTEPSYFYNQDGKIVNRFACRKDILISKHGCSPNDTEHNFCMSMGWYRIYDCGNLRFEMVFE